MWIDSTPVFNVYYLAAKSFLFPSCHFSAFSIILQNNKKNILFILFVLSLDLPGIDRFSCALLSTFDKKLWRKLEQKNDKTYFALR